MKSSYQIYSLDQSHIILGTIIYMISQKIFREKI